MNNALRVLARALAFAGVFAATLCAVEGGALLLNLRAGSPRPFLLDTSRVWDPPEGRRLSFVDPLLGAAYNPAVVGGPPGRYQHGFFVTGDPSDASALRIVTLGGSTTEESEGCWPAALQGLLAQAGVPSVVFNGGTSGQSTDQQVLKLIRDGLTLRPDLVISYDGVNDVGDGAQAPPFGYSHALHERLLDLAVNGASPWILPNAMALARRTLAGSGLEGIERGVPRDLTSAAAWSRNVRLMRAASEAFGARYLDVLQPALGIGAYRPSEDEARRVSGTRSCEKPYDTFYPEARALAAAGGGTTLDLVDVFVGLQDVYRDHCHVNTAGNRAVAQAILAELQRRSWLSRLSPSLPVPVPVPLPVPASAPAPAR